MLPRYSVKKPYTVIVGIILVIVLGVISFQKMTTDLLPSMNLPYVVIYTTYIGATPEQVEADVTRPMEAAVATLTDVKKITSSSRDNVSVVVMQFNDGANMDTALIELSSRLDQLRGEWDDAVGAPVAMKLNPDMLPVAILSVTRDDMDILALSEYVEDELVPAFEALNGVASATASGVIEQRVDVTIEPSRIDVLNSAILEDVDAELADAERQLDDAQAQLSDGKSQLSRAKRKVYRQIDDALAALDQGAEKLDSAIQQLNQQRADLVTQRQQLADAVAAMDNLVNLNPTQREAIVFAAQRLAELKQKLAELEQQLAEAEAAGNGDPLGDQRSEITAQRDALVAERATQQQYLDDLALLDADALRAEIAALESAVSEREAALSDAQAALQQLEGRRTELQSQIDDLTARLAEAEGEAAPTDESADAPTDPEAGTPTDGQTDGQSETPADGAAETPADGQAETPADGQAETPTDGAAETPADGQAETPADGQGETNQAGGEGAAATGDASGETTPSVPADVEPVSPQGEANGDTEPTDDAPTTPDGETPVDNASVTPDGEVPTEDAPAAPDSEAPAEEGSLPEGAGSPEGETEGVEAPDSELPADGIPDAPNSEAPANDASVAPDGETLVAAPEQTGESVAEKPALAASPTDEGSLSGEAGTQAAETESTDGDGSRAADPASADGASLPEEVLIPDEGIVPTEGTAPTEPAPMAFSPFAAQAEESDVSALRQQLDAARDSLSQLAADIDARGGEVAQLTGALESDRATLEARRNALSDLENENADVQSRMDEARRQIAALDERIAALELELAGLDQLPENLDAASLRQAIAEINAQIAALESTDAYKGISMLEDPEGLNAQYAQAKDGLNQIDAGIAQIDATLDKLNQGIIPGGYIEGIDEDTKLSDARAQLESAKKKADSGFSQAASQIRNGEAELAKARKEFEEKRDEALESAGLDGVITVQMVSGLIGAQNFSMPAGYVYDAENNQVLVRVGDKFDTLDALRRMKLFDLGLDSIDEVRLLDVARVELADNRSDVFTKLNGSDGILLSFDKQSTYSTADVAEAIMDKAKALTDADPGLHIVDLMNQGEYIGIIVDSVLNNLLSGGALAILVLLLFLMDIRPTITVAFSIPISVVIAFVCMYFSGITLNVLSLSGLSLGIGMLVDNSIVAIENIYRLHDEEGVPLLRACVDGVRSVSGALFASTLTTICVFLPILFVQGMARDLFSDMGLSIAFSLLASLLVAMTVVPAMCSFLMRRSKPKKHRVFGVIQRAYRALLSGALRVKPLVLLAALGLLAFAVMQVPKMGISFMPEVNSRQMSASLSFAPEMTDAEQKDQAVAIMDDMLEVKGVDSVGLMGGGGGLLGGLAGGDGMSYYIIVDEHEGRDNGDIAAELSAIGEKHAADLQVQASTMDISMMTGSGISAEITGEDIDTLQAIAADVAELARQTEGAIDVDDGLEDAVPELRIQVDKEKAIDKGLTTAQVFQFIAQKVAGRVEITQVTLDGSTMSVYLQDGANRDLRPEALEDLEIKAEREEETELVRIGDIATVREALSLSTIDRASQRRLVTVSFAVAEGHSANHVSDAFEAKLKDYAVPAGYAVTLSGENETVMSIMKDLVWMVMIAILLIFLIMVAQFQSFKSPIIVMFTIPLAFTGGLLALLITHMDLSIVSMIGFLVLSGVVVNNGIVFIDSVNQLRIAGMEKREALLETGRMRLRPILMTALTTILGVSTMALGQGTGAEMMQPMAVVSVGGLAYATLMTLFVVPALYDLLNGKTMKAREIQMMRETNGEQETGTGNSQNALENGEAAPALPEAAPVEAPADAQETVAATATPEPEKAPEEPPAAPGEDPVPVITPDSFKIDPRPRAIRVVLGPKK